jgi:hypothetical protein
LTSSGCPIRRTTPDVTNSHGRGAEVVCEAGADHVHRTDAAPILLHMQYSILLDAGGEAANVDRLFVADHSALAIGVGGTNPPHIGQALSLRTAEHLADRYLVGVADPIGDPGAAERPRRAADRREAAG